MPNCGINCHTDSQIKGMNAMQKFKIPEGTSEPKSATKSIRFPNQVIHSVEDAIRGTNCTFSAFVVEAVRVALDNLQDGADPTGWPPVYGRK